MEESKNQWRTFSIRVPRDLYEKLRAIAKREKRSLNEQIWLFVERAAQEPPSESPRADGRANSMGAEEKDA